MYRLDWISRWEQYSPDKVAIREHESGRAISYRQLNNAGANLAKKLTCEYHLKRGDRVAIIAENCLEYFILFTAAQKTGLVLVPLNYRLTSKEIDFLLGDSQPSFLFVEEKYRKSLQLEKTSLEIPVISIEELSAWCKLNCNDHIEFKTNQAIKENDPVFILYTSGTTGIPKGALYTHKMLFWNSINTALHLNISSEDRTITCAPLFHTGGWNVLSTPFLHHGAYFCLTKKFDAGTILKILESDSTTIFFGLPTMLKMLQNNRRFESVDLSKLRFCVVGGEAAPLPMIKMWHNKGAPIRQGYGMTEVGPNLTSLHQKDAQRKIGSIGTPNFYVNIKIVDDSGNKVSIGECGELLLGGPVVTPGYWNNTDATKKAIKNGWLHSGDVVRQDDEGFLYIVDRKKNMYISGGENVYPLEVERFLQSHPGIEEIAIVGVPHPKWGETGRAFIVPVSGSNLTAKDLEAFCRGNLARFKIPKYFCFVSSLPRGETGKVDRKKLQDLHQKGKRVCSKDEK